MVTAKSEQEVKYRTVRYAGKERDMTGLYYYGYRYYQPWLCRWLSADPAGTVDGLNLFCMVRNNPVTYRDEDGRALVDVSREYTGQAHARDAWFVMSTGAPGAAKLPFPDTYSPELSREWSNAARTGYEQAFYGKLNDAERTAVREWTALEEYDDDVHYSDGKPGIESGINYELNQKLSNGEALDENETRVLQNLDQGLSELPRIKGHYLRVDEYRVNEAGQGHPWLNTLAVGDIVTNAPRFMSVSASGEYASQTLTGELSNPELNNSLAFYHIEGEPVPLLLGIASLAEGEDEYLFPRGTQFEVKGISVAALQQSASDAFVPAYRIGVSLKQVEPRQGRGVKNIHTGRPLMRS